MASSSSGGQAPNMQQQQHGYGSGAASSYPMMQQSPAASSATGSQMMSPPTKDINAVNMCHVGQEIVHEIVIKAQEIFNLLTPKHIQLPNNQPNQAHHYAEKMKLEEQLRQINLHFRRLRLCFNKVCEAGDQTEEPSPQECVPMVGAEPEPSLLQTEPYRIAVEQHREMVEQVRLKNQELKEIVDSMRSIIWEINTMITMRKTL